MNESLQEELRAFQQNANALARVEHHPTAPVEEPALEPRDLADYSDEEVERIDSTTETGRKLLKKIAEAKMLRDNIQPLLIQWIESLKTEPWNVHLTSSEWEQVIRATQQLFQEFGLPLIPKSFDFCRRRLFPGMTTETD
ncbi:MAG: hypothetical protein WCC04_05745, partial [Terriglobales bacterium]